MSSSRGRSGGSFVLRYKTVATHLLVGAACFYAGIGVGVRVGFIDCSEICRKQEVRLASMRGGDEGQRGLVLNDSSQSDVICDRKLDDNSKSSSSSSSGTRFPSNVKQFATGVSSAGWFKINICSKA